MIIPISQSGLALLIVTLLTPAFTTRTVAQSRWQRQNSGTSVNLYAVKFVDAIHGFAAGENGTVLRTGDGGRHWESAPIPTGFPVRALSFLTRDSGWAVTGDVNNVDAGGEVWKTVDGGSTWTRQPRASSRARLGVSFATGDVGWACGARNGPLDIDATTDGGSTFSTQTDAAIFGWTYGIEAIDRNLVWATGGTYFPTVSGFILFSTNGGTKWNQKAIGVAPFFYALDFPDKDHGYVAGTAGAVYATTDAGETWVPRVTGSSAILRSVAFAGPAIGIVCGDGGALLATSDGGVSWSDQSIASGANLNGACAIDATHGWVAGDNGAIWCNTPDASSADPVPPSRFQLHIVPMPAISSVSFLVDQGTTAIRPVSMRIFSVTGREVYRHGDVTSASLQVSSSTLGTGTFFYVCSDGRGHHATGAFILLGP